MNGRRLESRRRPPAPPRATAPGPTAPSRRPRSAVPLASTVTASARPPGRSPRFVHETDSAPTTSTARPTATPPRRESRRARGRARRRRGRRRSAPPVVNATGSSDELVLAASRTSPALRRESGARSRRTRSRRRESRRCTATPGLRNTSAGIALLHDASAIEHDRDVAEQSGFGEIVRDLQHGESPLEVDRAQQAARDAARARVERAERLVEQQHFGPPRQRARDRDELTFAAAQRADGAIVRARRRRTGRPRRRRRPRSPRRTRRSREPSGAETDTRVDRRCRAACAPAARASRPRRRG